MTYDDWKTKDDQPEGEPKQETELELVYADLARLRASHAALLAAAKELLAVASENCARAPTRECQTSCDSMADAIAAAEEPAP